jgi:AraC family cel operon transcriptional repressor
MPRFRLENFLSSTGRVHVACNRCRPGQRSGVEHHHDFAEVFWVESGRGTHRVNGQVVQLQAGRIAFIRPRDRHSLQAGPDGPMVFTNLALAASTLEKLRKRYYESARQPWPWREGRLPWSVLLEAEDVTHLSRRSRLLQTGLQEPLEVDAFLLDLLWIVRRQGESSRPGIPSWLSGAMERFSRLEDLSIGPAGLARVAGKSPEHLNRTFRELFGVTTTQYIHEVRLNRASRLLRLTDKPISSIALDCGYENLGYFYRRFVRKFGLAPRKYRLSGRS